MHPKRVGCSLRGIHCKGNLVPSRKQVTPKLTRTKGSLSSHKRVSGPVLNQYSSHSYRQHNSGCLYKQGGRDKVGPSVCPNMENPDLVHQETGYFQGLTHSRAAECNRGQAIQARPDNPDRMVPPLRGLLGNMVPVAPASNGSVCHQVQQQTALICITSPRPPGMPSHQ